MADHQAAAHPDPGDERDPGQVRPYALTGGRTRPERDGGLPVEALVSLSPAGQQALARAGGERREILALSRDLLSVAEIAARRHVPLGVARVLVSDLAGEGLLTVYRHDDRPDLLLLERVLDGLRRA